jgi:hypothetical protein
VIAGKLVASMLEGDDALDPKAELMRLPEPLVEFQKALEVLGWQYDDVDPENNELRFLKSYADNDAERNMVNLTLFVGLNRDGMLEAYGGGTKVFTGRLEQYDRDWEEGVEFMLPVVYVQGKATPSAFAETMNDAFMSAPTPVDPPEPNLEEGQGDDPDEVSAKNYVLSAAGPFGYYRDPEAGYEKYLITFQGEPKDWLVGLGQARAMVAHYNAFYREHPTYNPTNESPYRWYFREKYGKILRESTQADPADPADPDAADPDAIDPKSYLTADSTVYWHKVYLLTLKEVRKWFREMGFRVTSIYRRKRGSIAGTVVPIDLAQFQVTPSVSQWETALARGLEERLKSKFQQSAGEFHVTVFAWEKPNESERSSFNFDILKLLRAGSYESMSAKNIIRQVREQAGPDDFDPRHYLRDINWPPKFADLDQFTKAYIEAALWSSNDESTPEGGEPLENNYGPDDIAPETLKQIYDDCQEFQRENADDLAHGNPQRGGHDFWLTRNGHGAGFWDGDWPDDVGERLTDAAHRYGEVNLYVGDDGKIY